MVPFVNVYKAEHELDPRNPHHKPLVVGLAEKLTTPEALEQFLTWLVQGAVQWYQHGLGEKPELLKAAQQEYVEENDILSRFIRDCCNTDPSFKVAFEVSTESKMSPQAMKSAMEARKFRYSSQRINGQMTRVFTGVQLKQ